MQPLSFLLIAVAATGALAAPTSGTHTNAVIKRDFKIHAPPPRVGVRSPRSQIQRTFAKYGWEIVTGDTTALNDMLDDVASSLLSANGTATVAINVEPTISSGPTNSSSYSAIATSSVTKLPIVVAPISTNTQDGISEVNATPESGDREYLAPVSIGGQTFDLDFDTGSADLTRQSVNEIGSHSAFNPGKSSTWTDYDNAGWEILYGDRSSASGDVGFDRVTIGDMTVAKQAVELATKVSAQFEQDIDSDGLLGLGFSNMNTIQPARQKTWFENIMDQLEQPLFTADLLDKTSTYEFGVIDTSKFVGDVHFALVDSSNGYWQFDSNSYTVGDTQHDCTACGPAIADTGTSLMLVDPHVVETYYAQVSGAYYSSEQAGYIYDCNAVLPDFGVAVGDHIATLDSAGLTWAAVGDGTCFGAIQSNQGSGLQIYGDTFFKQFFAVFDAGNMMFGVAAKNSA
nr:putative aspergillopepsin a-like aspartic endopeptidase [Quercus suber]